MHKYANRFDDFFAACVDAYTSLAKTPIVNLNGRTLVAKSKTAEKIYQSLERMDADDRVIHMCKVADKYVNDIADAIKQHTEGCKRQIALVKDSILPLLKIDAIFKQTYGDDAFNIVADKTPIIYFPNYKNAFDGSNEGSYQLFIIETISHDISVGAIDALSKDLITHVQCTEADDDGQLAYPDFKATVTPVKKPATLSGLGYTNVYATIGLDKLINTGQHISLFSNINGFLKSIEKEKRDALKWINAVRHFDKDLPKYIGMIKSVALKHQIYCVALGSLMVIINAVARTAYDAAYKFHVAEVNYNKSQFK